MAYGQAFGADVEFSALASAGYGVQSVQRYVDLGGRSSESPLNAQMPRFFDVGARYRDLSLRLIYDDYRQETADGYGETLDAPVTLGFQGLFADVQYALRPCEGLSLTPRVAYKRQSPWRSRDTSQTTFYDKTADQLQLSLMADFDAIEDLDVLSGAEFSVDKGRLNDRRILGTQQPFRGENGLTVLNGAGYVQAAWSPDLLTVVAGIRTEFSDRFTASVVPRLGLMHNFDRFYVKGLATRAFRTPALENIGIQGTDPVSGGPAADIEPEQTTILELEGGYLVPYLMSLSVNVFDMHLRNPIIFNYDPALGGEVYRNDVSTGTQGLEAVARAMGDWGQLDLSYSTYSAAGRNHVRQYAVAEDEDALLGAARHKVALLGRFSLPGRLWLAPSAVFLSERAYVVGHDTPEPGDMSLRQEPEVALEPPSLRLNWFLNWAPGFAAGLHLGAGVFDVFDSGFRFAQPHDSGHAPLPDRGREFVLKLGYALPLGGEAPPE